jgi:glycerophosphoryl diester phosphodiesterase/ankyrin repeat protein
VDAFFAPELEAALTQTATLSQRTADYVRADIACVSGLDSLLESITGLVRKLQDLRDFARVNSEGFRKTAKKLQKRTPHKKYDYLVETFLPSWGFFRCQHMSRALELCSVAAGMARRSKASLQAEMARALEGSPADRTSEEALALAKSALDLVSSRSVFEGGVTFAIASSERSLRTALRTENHERISYLLRTTGVPASTVLSLAAPLLHAMVRSGDVEAIRHLVAFGVPIDIPDVAERSPLEMAVRHRQVAVVELLLELGADPSAVSRSGPFQRRTPLHQAVLLGDAQCTDLLLRKTAERRGVICTLLALDRNGHSACYLAAASGHPRTLSVLLAWAARELVPGGQGEEAATMVLREWQMSRVETVVSLVPLGSGMPKAGEDMTVDVSAVWEKVWNTHGLLRRGGADGLFWSCVHAAAQAGSHDCVSLLLSSGGDKALHDAVGAACSTALHEASGRGHLRCVNRLLEAGASPAMMNAYCETPLHLAARSGRKAVVRCLLPHVPSWALRCRLDTSVLDIPNVLPAAHSLPELWVPVLHEAVEAASDECCKLLTAAGSDPEETDTLGWSALALALFGGQPKIVAVLREAARRNRLKREEAAAVSGCEPTADAALASAVGVHATVDEDGELEVLAGDSKAESEDKIEQGHSSLKVGEWELHVMLGGSGGGPKGSIPRPAISLRGAVGQAIPSRRLSVQVRPWEHHELQTHWTPTDGWAASTQVGGSEGAPSSEGGGFSVTLPLKKRTMSGPSRRGPLPRHDSTESVVSQSTVSSYIVPQLSAALTTQDELSDHSDDEGLNLDHGSNSSDSGSLERMASNVVPSPVLPSASAGSSAAMAVPLVTASVDEVWETASPMGDTELNTSNTIRSVRSRGPFELGVCVEVASGVGVHVGRAMFPPSLLLGLGGALPRPPSDVVSIFGASAVALALEGLCDPSQADDSAVSADVRSVMKILSKYPWGVSDGLTMEGEVTVPLIGPVQQPLGMVTLRYLFVRPYTPLPGIVPSSKSGAATRAYWRQTRVVGHRGAGADNAAEVLEPAGGKRWRTHVMENTVLSFVTAASLGAEYVEFDVQLSSDGVPVVYHDFSVKLPQGVRVPVSHLTAVDLTRLAPLTDADFRTLKAQPVATAAVPPPLAHGRSTPHVAGGGEAVRVEMDLSMQPPPTPLARRSARSHRTIEAMGLDPREHMERSSLYYGLRDSVASLAETFRRVPSSCGFNIEMKYPSEEQTRTELLVPPDRNTYVDRVLDCVFANAGSRGVIFSSFDPDVCLLLNRKQGTYPVFLLTEAGTEFDADPRRNSLREAIRFARSVGLFGIVSDSTPLLEAPVLVSAVRSAGLVLATYGRKNNQIEFVKLQQRLGVAAIIVDHVAHISRGLRSGPFEEQPPSSS